MSKREHFSEPLSDQCNLSSECNANADTDADAVVTAIALTGELKVQKWDGKTDESVRC